MEMTLKMATKPPILARASNIPEGMVLMTVDGLFGSISIVMLKKGSVTAAAIGEVEVTYLIPVKEG
jgi:hypothetical protein